MNLPCEQHTANVWVTSKTSVRRLESVVDYAPIPTTRDGRSKCALLLDADACLRHPDGQLPIDAEVLQRDWFDPKSGRFILENMLPKARKNTFVLVVITKQGMCAWGGVDVC